LLLVDLFEYYFYFLPFIIATLTFSITYSFRDTSLLAVLKIRNVQFNKTFPFASRKSLNAKVGRFFYSKHLNSFFALVCNKKMENEFLHLPIIQAEFLVQNTCCIPSLLYAPLSLNPPTLFLVWTEDKEKHEGDCTVILVMVLCLCVYVMCVHSVCPLL
jgi:hypothetical protein